MASMPSYDPNSFSDGIGRTEWKTLSEDPRKPFAQQDGERHVPPGSTLKPMAALAFRRPGSIPRSA
jgi:penicillin-binding protein 2